MQKLNLTKSLIENLSLPPSGRVEYSDSKIQGLTLRVSYSGIKVFYFLRRYKKELIRIKIGKYPDLDVTSARNKVAEYNAKIAQKINPLDAVRESREELTFAALFDTYMTRWAIINKKSYREDSALYQLYLEPSLLKRKYLSDISKKEIAQIFTSISQKKPRTANKVLALLSSVFNRAIEWGLCETNPCKGIKKNKEKARERFLSQEELPRFFEAVNSLSDPIMRSFFLISLFTGARRANVLAMRWDELDFARGEWLIPETKNGTSQRVPLTPLVIEILQSLVKTRINAYVFASPLSASGHLQEPKKAWKKVLNAAHLNDLRIHDLRRTFGSWQAITGASLAIIGKSLNHKSITATQIYARLSVDPIRKSVQKAQEAMLKFSKKN